MAQLEQAYQESRQRLKQAVQDGASVGVAGGIATPIKNESHSTFSPGVAVAPTTQLEINKGISADSVGSTPSSSKGMVAMTNVCQCNLTHSSFPPLFFFVVS